MSDNTAALVNGSLASQISLSDRGLNYGDGLFETIAAPRGQLQFWERHMARLSMGCRRLGLSAPDVPRLLFEAQHLLQDQESAVVKIVLTRGSEGRGYQPNPTAPVTRIVRRLRWPEFPGNPADRGIRMNYSPVSLGRNPLLAGIKHLNRLEQVLASRQLQEENAEEALLSDDTGNLIEGTRSNLFLVRQGTLYTPDLQQCGVAGILRSVIMDLCRQEQIPCKVTGIGRQDIENAEEIFMTNSLMGIWPVREMTGVPCVSGPLTRQLQAKLTSSVPGEQWYP